MCMCSALHGYRIRLSEQVEEPVVGEEADEDIRGVLPEGCQGARDAGGGSDEGG